MGIFFRSNKRWLVLIATFGLCVSVASAQVTLKVSTDKSTYEYGEPIEVRVEIRNDTADSFQLSGSSSCQAQFTFDGYDSSARPCTTDLVTIDFRPGSWRGWVWTINPQQMGLPRTDGEHTIVGFYPGTELADTLVVAAPAYLGGRLLVYIKDGVEESQLTTLRDSLNAQIVVRDERPGETREIWQIEGVNIFNAENEYAADSRFSVFRALDVPLAWVLVGQEDEIEVVQTSELRSVYPNPCSVQCGFEMEVKQPQFITFKVSDLLGRSLLQWNESVHQIGTHQFEVDMSQFPPGPYFLSASGIDFSSNKMFVKQRE